MATLNIKNLPESPYRKLKVLARRQRRSVTQEVIRILTEATEADKPLSILELRGLGKHLWKEAASDHVDRERRSWD